jgi:uncharacterized membrane protein YsdA (DUF1294 family)
MGILEKAIIIINLAAFLLMGWDKFKAKKGWWRIPEKTFFILAAVLGASGVLLGMKIFHHKTKHREFTIGVPFFLILNIACYYYLRTI